MSKIVPGISPSMMCADALNLGADAVALEQAGAQFFHYDVMDGDFCAESSCRAGRDPLPCGKVSAVPADHPPDGEESGAAPAPVRPAARGRGLRAPGIHRAPAAALSAIRAAGAKAAVALNPATPLCAIEDVLPDLDMVLLMTVNPGFAARSSSRATLPKIARLRAMLDSAGYPQVRIEVDGNVSFENAVRMRQAGADLFVAGTSSVFREGGIAANMEKLLSCIQ